MRRRRSGSEQRSNLYLLTGLVIGLVLGLLYAWVISPVEFVDTDPSSLAAPHKDEYRRVAALAYAANGDLERARERLNLIDAGAPIPILAAQAQRLLAENQPPQEARALAVLAADLGRTSEAQTTSPPAVAQLTGEATAEETTSAPLVSATAILEVAAIQTPTIPKPTFTPTVTRTPMPTFTPRPTATPMSVLDAPFIILSKKEVCDQTIQPGLLQIGVTDEDGVPLPGVKIQVSWLDGENVFYTGLAPDISPGYADFSMIEGVTYSLKVGEASETINNISIPACGGGWNTEFQEGG